VKGWTRRKLADYIIVRLARKPVKSVSRLSRFTIITCSYYEYGSQSPFDLHGSDHIRSLLYPFDSFVGQPQLSDIGLLARIVIPEVLVLFVLDHLLLNAKQ
jgi:hypothetical protein